MADVSFSAEYPTREKSLIRFPLRRYVNMLSLMIDWMTPKLDPYQKWKLDQNQEKCLC